MRFLIGIFCLVFAVAPCWAAQAAAPAQKSATTHHKTAKTKNKTVNVEGALGDFGGWKTFRYLEQGQHVCYMIAHPLNPTSIRAEQIVVQGKGKKARRIRKTVILPREAYAMITFRPSESMAPVFTYNAGAILKDGSEAALTAGKEKFSLFTSQDSAWARSTALDQSIARAMIGGGEMNVAAASAKYGKLQDRFDLKGADPAYKKIATACGIP